MVTIRKGALFCAAAAILVSQGLRFVPESSPVERGAAAANSQTCIDCHGKSESRWPDGDIFPCSGEKIDDSHPIYAGRCSDILAYFEVVRLKQSFSSRSASVNQNRLLKGEALARQYNCFQCHGELGQGGFRNEGALKGYIPGYFGKDFALLTRNGNTDSVRSWISHGIDPALYAKPIEGPIAEYFIERQEVSMPVFGSLPDSTIQILAEYVISLNRFGAMDANGIRAYGEQTQLIQEQVLTSY